MSITPHVEPRDNHRSLHLARRTLLAPALLTLLASCASDASDRNKEATGRLDFALTLEGLQLDSVEVVIDSDALSAPRQRELDVEEPQATLSFLEHGLPPGSYSVSLAGTPVDDPATDADESEIECKGSRSNIAVEEGEVSVVDDLVLTCTLDGGEVYVAGGIRVTARAEVVQAEACTDVVAEFSVGSLETKVGASVDIVAVPVDGASVVLSSKGGTLTDSSLKCPELAGQVTVQAKFVSDGGCEQTLSETIRCVNPPSLRVAEGSTHLYTRNEGGATSFLGVVFDGEGNYYAVGPTAVNPAPTTDQSTVVAKFLPDGSLDTSFGDGGYAEVNISVGAREQYRAISLQHVDGADYLVVAGTAPVNPGASGVAALEQDTALARFTLSGELDTRFGTDGIAWYNLNTGVASTNNAGNPTWVGNETIWSLSVAPDGKLIAHGSQRSEEFNQGPSGQPVPRTDTDWALVRFNADGTIDESFGNGGKVTVDIGKANASARSATLLADGSVVGVGYTTSTVLGVSSQQPVLYKVTSDGQFDSTFATADAWSAPGVFHDLAVRPPFRAEAYGAAQQGNAFVTLGYGPTNGAGRGSDMIALRFTDDGVFDTTFGTNGATYVDGDGYSDNGRTTVILPDHQVIGVGGGGRNTGEDDPPYDGLVALLSEGGVPVADFGERGRRFYEFGGEDDFLWGGALSPDGSQVVLVGLAGTGAATQGAVVRLPLEALP